MEGEFDIDEFELFTGVETAERDPTDTDGDEATIEKRPRGILSHADREFLYGLREYEHPQTAANRKQDIRDRIIHALADFPLLWLYLPADEREKIFTGALSERELEACLQAMLSFVYQGLDRDTERFEDLIELAVHVGENTEKLGRWNGEATDVEVSIDIEYNPDIDRLKARLAEDGGAGLTPSEIGMLVRAGELTMEELEGLEDPRGQYTVGALGVLMLAAIEATNDDT